jgi:transcription elongation factor Elf1
MNYIDLKYTNLLSNRLDRFSVKGTNPYRVNFRCPICGDSTKSKTKTRGWILEKNNSAIMYCHNCGASMGLRKFLQHIDPILYNDYIIDTRLDKDILKKQVAEITSPLDKLTHKVPTFKKSGSPLLDIRKISQLKDDHPAKTYIKKRLIPNNKHYKLYYTPKFNAWVNSIIPDKMPDVGKDAPRLILPFIDKEGKLFGFQGRAFDEYSLRYITIMIDDEMPKIFGLDTVDFERKYYVVEGPIDSLFLDNAVAMAGADGSGSGLSHIENAVMVFDNEPRNKQICDRMENCLEQGYKVCIWPTNVIDNDINDAILKNKTSADIQLIIDQNTYSGLQGKLKLSYWRKC